MKRDFCVKCFRYDRYGNQIDSFTTVQIFTTSDTTYEVYNFIAQIFINLHSLGLLVCENFMSYASIYILFPHFITACFYLTVNAIVFNVCKQVYKNKISINLLLKNWHKGKLVPDAKTIKIIKCLRHNS